MIEIIPNWHPIFVNFTVALFTVSALLYIVALLSPNAPWRHGCLAAAHWNLALGAGFALITVGTGLNAYYTVAHDSPSHAAMTNHRNWAFAAAGVIVAMALWQWFRRRRDSQPNVLLAVTMMLAGGLLTVTAWKGAELVFRYGLGVMALIETEGPGHNHEHPSDEHGSLDLTSGQGGEQGLQADHDHEKEAVLDDGEDQTLQVHSHAKPDPGREPDHSHEGNAAVVPKDGPTSAIINFHAALKSGDEQTVMATLAPEVLIFESGGAERSRAEYASHHMNSDMAFLNQMERDVIEQETSLIGNSAWIVTESRLHGRHKEKDFDLVSIETAVLKRGVNGWKIVHLHWSSREQ